MPQTDALTSYAIPTIHTKKPPLHERCFSVISQIAPRKIGAGDENRTHVASLEGWSSTIELHPQITFLSASLHFSLNQRNILYHNDVRLSSSFYQLFLFCISAQIPPLISVPDCRFYQFCACGGGLYGSSRLLSCP